MLRDIIFRFLLAFLTIDMILQETTIFLRREKLSEMKSNLGFGGAYGETLERIKAQGEGKARLGMAVLMWISHSRRPLQVDEICHALAVRIGSNDLDSDNIPRISTMLACCQGLVTIEKGTSTIRLIHYTLQEYICTLPDLFDSAHSTMAETCLTYLNFQHIKDLSAGPPPDPRDTPFLEYSSLYWGAHMRMQLSDQAEIFALQLLDQFDIHISAKFLWKSIKEEFVNLVFGLSSDSNCKGFSALHCISYFGIAKVANTLIEMDKWDVNNKDGGGISPLIWAAICGHEEVVMSLLQEKHVQPDERDTYSGRTALSWAAGCGHEGVVRLFLGPQFANPGSIGRRWGVPLVAGKLFGWRYVNPDAPDTVYGRTPLSRAAENGHSGIVKLLLEQKDVNPNTPDTEDGLTPLSWAARNGHEGIVKLFLERKDVNPNTPFTKYSQQTPLSWAAKNGHEGIVKLFLERKDVDPDTLDRHGLTPLSLAADNGHEGIVKLLLKRNGVNPDTPGDLYGITPLMRAAKNGHEGIVKLLLARKDVNPNTPDRSLGRTPILWAAEYGREGIVKLLLERKDVNPNTPHIFGHTPLQMAAQNGHDRVVKLLQARLPDVSGN